MLTPIVVVSDVVLLCFGGCSQSLVTCSSTGDEVIVTFIYNKELQPSLPAEFLTFMVYSCQTNCLAISYFSSSYFFCPLRTLI